MNRIVVIGSGGSGKSHLARALGAATAIPVTHLDSLYYDHQWQPLPAERFAQLQHELTAQLGWIIDGNYASTLSWTCLWGILQRRLRHGAGQHDRLGVYNRITWSFLRYIVGYRRRMRPRVQRLLAEHAGHAEVVVLRSRRAAARYLATVNSNTAVR